MIAKSTLYKLVRKESGRILAEGNKKEMKRLQKANPGTFIGLTNKNVGEYWK